MINVKEWWSAGFQPAFFCGLEARAPGFRALGAMIVSLLFILIAVDATAQNKAECPSIVADERDGTYISKSAPKFPYRCYSRPKDAKAKGFISQAQVKSSNFTGWYRLNLKLVGDSCNPGAPAVSPVLFLQVRDSAVGVFGEFCPVIGEYSGVYYKNGFVISGIRDNNLADTASFCGGGQVREHEYIELTKGINKSTDFSVKYTQLRTCTSSSDQNVCAREFSGQAFYETHSIWPTVPDKASALREGCQAALSTCSSCHQNLATLPPLKP